MNISIFKVFTIIGIVSTWAEKALADNKVTLTEAVDLVEPIAHILGVPTELPGPEVLPEPEKSDTRDALGKTL